MKLDLIDSLDLPTHAQSCAPLHDCERTFQPVVPHVHEDSWAPLPKGHLGEALAVRNVVAVAVAKRIDLAECQPQPIIEPVGVRQPIGLREPVVEYVRECVALGVYLAEQFAVIQCVAVGLGVAVVQCVKFPVGERQRLDQSECIGVAIEQRVGIRVGVGVSLGVPVAIGIPVAVGVC